MFGLKAIRRMLADHDSKLNYMLKEIRDLQKPKLVLKSSKPPYSGLRCGVARFDGGTCQQHIKREGDVCRYHAKRISAEAIDRTNHAE